MSDTTSGFAPSGGFLSDPFTAAMLGMSAGFANAAMPSRLPVPLGAAIGMGSQGFMQGGFGAQRYGLGQEQLRAAQLQNELLGARLPLFEQAIKQQLALTGGAPMGVPSMGGGAPGVMPAVTGDAASAGGANSPYLTGPQIASMAQTNSLLGNDSSARSLWNLYGSIPTPGYTWMQNGGIGFAANGPHDPGVIARNTAIEKWAGVPAEIAAARGRAHYDWTNITVPDVDANGRPTGNFHLEPVTKDRAPDVIEKYYGGGAGGAPSAPTGQMPPAPALPPELQPFGATAQRIQQGENGTGNPGAKNPNSSATGNGQFINSTWLNEFQQHFPQLAAQMTPQQVLSLRADPGWSNYMTAAYARDNAQVLQQAGFDASPVNLALAHRFGPDGALRILRLNQTAPTTPMRLAFGDEVLRANPDLAGLKIGNVVGGAQQRMQGIALGQPYQVAGAGAAVPSPAPAAAPSLTPSSHNDEQFGGAPAAAPAPMPAGTVGGMPVLTPQQSTELKAHEADLEAQAKNAPEIEKSVNEAARNAGAMKNRLDQARIALQEAAKGGINSGYFSPELATAAAAAKSLGVDLSALGIDPKAVSNAQSAQEALAQISGEILKRLFPQRITNMDIKLYGEKLAHFAMDPGALQQVLGIAEAQSDYDIARARFMNQWKVKHSNSSVGWEPAFYLANGYGPQDVRAALGLPENTPENGPAPANAKPAAAPAQQGGAYREGQTATNPKNGQRIIFRNGAWVPFTQ